MHNITTKVPSHVTFQPRSQQQKQSRLDLFAQRDSKNREEILDRTLEENHSSGNFSTLIIEKKTQYNIQPLLRAVPWANTMGYKIPWVQQTI